MFNARHFRQPRSGIMALLITLIIGSREILELWFGLKIRVFGRNFFEKDE